MNFAICAILGFIFLAIFGPYLWNMIQCKEQNGDPNEFKCVPVVFIPGDKVECLRNVYFIDDTFHLKGDILEVTEETEAYYNVMRKDYKLVI